MKAEMNKMKEYLKKVGPSYILALALSYMLFIYEPVLFYSNNMNDLWFDLPIILNPSFLLFTISFLGISLILNLSYFINKKVYKVMYIIVCIGYFFSYIQGNYLVGSLPILDGNPINWNAYTLQNIISIVLLLIIIIVIIISAKKLENFMKYTAFIAIATIIMISTSFVSILLSTSGEKKKDVIISYTYDYFNTYSDKENFIILLLDAVDSKDFSKALRENEEFKDLLKDFTYYPDTLSGHPFTLESIPYVLTGERYQHQEDFIKWQTNAMKSSPLLANLSEKKYEVNLYDKDVIYNDPKALEISNAIDINGLDVVDKKEFMKEEIRYVLFRYLPFPLKKYSHIEYLNFSLAGVAKKDEVNYYDEDNFLFLDKIEEKYTMKDKKQFKYIHLDGAHIPFNFDKNFEHKDKGDYYDEVLGMGTLVNKYLNKLKENKVYDNSTIILMADHGYNIDATIYGRQNPILYIKGKNETHNTMNISDKPIAFEDLNNAYKDLLEGKKSTELFASIENNRTRKYLLYTNEEKNMVEYETKGKAWETDKMTKTGLTFDPIR